jgi:hypothetical protein
VDEVLQRMGVERGGLLDTVQSAVETVHGRTADAVESAGRRVAEAAERIRPGGGSQGIDLTQRSREEADPLLLCSSA